MKKNTIRQLTQGLLLTLSVALTVCRLGAADLNLGTNMPPLEFHGFVSQGFLATTKYNYLGSNTKDGSFKFTEAGLNVSMNPFPRTRITAQGFLFDVGSVGKYQPVLDFASVEYVFNDYIGLRGGRIRRPAGIYNDIQYLDLTRTAVLLPQAVYDTRQRDFISSLDGGAVFGGIPLSKAGNLSYEFYIGMIRPQADGGLGQSIQNNLPPNVTLNSISSSLTVGGQLWWNTPLDGLRVGAGGMYVFDGTLHLTAHLPPPPSGPGNVHILSVADIIMPQFSLEYQWKSWTFQSEYSLKEIELSPAQIADGWYAGAAYRFNKWFETGAYYSEYYGDTSQRDNSLTYQKDLALSFRFDPKPWWVFKVEGHYIRGTGLLDDNADNPVRNGDGWFMIAVKTTFSF